VIARTGSRRSGATSTDSHQQPADPKPQPNSESHSGHAFGVSSIFAVDRCGAIQIRMVYQPRGGSKLSYAQKPRRVRYTPPSSLDLQVRRFDSVVDSWLTRLQAYVSARWPRLGSWLAG
jgi:hypothetical protein